MASNPAFDAGVRAFGKYTEDRFGPQGHPQFRHDEAWAAATASMLAMNSVHESEAAAAPDEIEAAYGILVLRLAKSAREKDGLTERIFAAIELFETMWPDKTKRWNDRWEKHDAKVTAQELATHTPPS